MEGTDRDDYAKMLKEAYRGVVIGIFVFASMVAYIFWSSSYAWQQKQRRLELAAQQRIAAQLAKLSDVGVYAWVNNWEVIGGAEGVYELRDIEKLQLGTEYKVGRLRMYDVNLRYGFNQVMPNVDDDIFYVDPIITFAYNGFIHVKYSIDSDEGWFVYGETRTGLKTGTYQYIPDEELTTPERDGWGENMMSVRLPANGQNNFEVNVNDKNVSEAMRDYNYYIDEKLGEAYSGVPTEYANRTRRVHTSHLIVEVYKEDPRVKGAKKTTPELTFKIRIRSYGEWDLTDEEYRKLIFDVPALTERDYAPRTTAELVQ